MTRFSPHIFDVHDSLSTKNMPHVQAGKHTKTLVGMALLLAIGMGFYSLSNKTSDTQSDKISVAHVRPTWH